ncbi:MAG: acetyl-CoA carboxylase biotin carboxyl carrier protein [Deltaproteobacteria bacterium]
MDLKDIKQIIKVLEGTDVTEIEVEQEGVKVRVKRGGFQQLLPVATAPVIMPEAMAPSPQPSPSGRGGESEKPAEKESPKLKTISSPMVGTFYITPAPDAPPFVTVGSVVTKGQTLCIIEAMKLMNEIEAECSGKIASILVENAQAIEYGEPLFMIEPA